MKPYKASKRPALMNSGRNPKNTMLAALLGLCLPHALRAQYVQVPIGSGCVVVVAGTGGNTGLNRVGHGGVVRMIDGFDSPGSGGNFTFAGPTVHAWTLAGDLSMQVDYNQVAPVSGANPAVQSAGPVTTVNIQSYNKNLRAIELSAASKGRSKGRVSVRYKAAPCDSTLVFDVFKEWTSGPPPISFPNCWPSILQTVSLSVDPLISDNAGDLIGVDQYYWKLTNGGGTDLFTALTSAYTFSADRSSIQLFMGDPAFQSWYTGGPYTVQCCYGRANAWDGGAGPLLGRLLAGTTCSSQVIGMPVVPSYTGGFPTCVNAVSPTLPITVLSSNYNSAYTYSWTRTNLSWSFTPNGTGGLTINSIGDGNPCTFFLNLSGPCGSTTHSYTVNRSYNNAAMLATSSPYCASVGTFTVNLGSSYQGNQTCWGTLPAGWSAVNAGSANVTFTIPAAAAGSTNTINLFSCGDCSATPLAIVINVRPATPGPISGPNCVTAGVVTPNFSVPQAGTFTWTPPGGWTGGGTTNTVTFTPNSTGGTVSVTLNGQPGCPSLAATKVVNVYPVITQPSCINTGVATTGAVFTSTIAGTVWSFPAGLTASVPPAGTTATINIIGTAGSYPCTATANGCVTNFTVVVPAIPSISPTNYVTQVSNVAGSSTVWVDFNPANLYRLWNCTTNTPVTGWTSLQSSWQLINPGAGSFTVQVDTPPLNCGFFNSPCVATTFSAMLEGGNLGSTPGERSSIELGSGPGVIISPNPSDGEFTVGVMGDFSEGRVLMYDAEGKRVGNTTRIVPGMNTISQRNLAPGVYQLRIEMDDKLERRSVVINQDH